MITIQKELQNILFNELKPDYKIEPGDIQFSIPPQRKFGDISTTIPFVLAKKAGEKPFLIGKKLVEKLSDKIPFISEVRIEGGGFLNFTLERKSFLDHLLLKRGSEPEKNGIKVIVEHTSINPNKSAHIGHIRNSSLGDTLAKSLKFLGFDVEIQNYLDDTGIQVADVVWGLMEHDGKSGDDIREIDDLPLFLWKRYPYYSSKISDNEANSNSRNIVHKKIEEKKEPYYSASTYIAEVVVKDHIALMERLNIRYDSLVRESDIIELKLFEEASGILEDKKIMYQSEDPEKENCRVIRYSREDIEKIVIRSNGTATYIAKDIAYALWKVGLLKKNFYFKKFFEYSDGKIIHMSDFEENGLEVKYGDGDRVFTVIDVRQSYLQKIISEEVIAPLSEKGKEKEYIHFSYEMVALTPGCVEDLGFDLSEEEKKRSYIEVSGRKGIAVSGEELIDKLIEKSKGEIIKRNPDLDSSSIDAIARDIAVGALRYYMIKFNSNSVISFDFDDALSFEGDTGPYMQYTMARINSIFRKIEETTISGVVPDPAILGDEESELFFDILLHISLIEVQLDFAVEKREISSIASHSYQLCQKLNHYYHQYPVISENNAELKGLRIALLTLFRENLTTLFNIMGIPVPERM
ncbi:MAG: arginine--tRNA ligase [Acidobacteriota bacterium]